MLLVCIRVLLNVVLLFTTGGLMHGTLLWTVICAVVVLAGIHRYSGMCHALSHSKRKTLFVEGPKTGDVCEEEFTQGEAIVNRCCRNDKLIAVEEKIQLQMQLRDALHEANH